MKEFPFKSYHSITTNPILWTIMRAKLFLLILNICLLATSTSCYKMPTEYDYCVVPTTNNRDVTRERPQSPVPGAGM